MAVNESKVTTTLILKVKTGMQSGQATYKNMTFRKVKTSAGDSDIYDVAQGIANILAYPLDSVYKQDVNQLINA